MAPCLVVFLIFHIFLKKVRPLRNMHRHERIACAALPGSSMSSNFERKKGSGNNVETQIPSQFMQVMNPEGGSLKRPRTSPRNDPTPPPKPRTLQTCYARWRIKRCGITPGGLITHVIADRSEGYLCGSHVG